jgi:lipopolysaccharide assembly protein A
MSQEEQSGNYGWKIILAIFIILLVVVFSIQNNTETSVKFWFWDSTAPLVLILFFSFILGLLLMLIMMWPMSRRIKRKNKTIAQLEERIATLERTNIKKDPTDFQE